MYNLVAEPTYARTPEAAQYSGRLLLCAGERLPLLCRCVRGNGSGGRRCAGAGGWSELEGGVGWAGAGRASKGDGRLEK